MRSARSRSSQSAGSRGGALQLLEPRLLRGQVKDASAAPRGARAARAARLAELAHPGAGIFGHGSSPRGDPFIANGPDRSMRMSTRTRVAWLLGGGALLVAAALGAYFAAVSVVRGAVATALGPRARDARRSGSGSAGWSLEDVRVRAPSGWPAEETFARRAVSVVPRLLTLLSGDVVRIRSIDARRALSLRASHAGRAASRRCRACSAAKWPPARTRRPGSRSRSVRDRRDRDRVGRARAVRRHDREPAAEDPPRADRGERARSVRCRASRVAAGSSSRRS